MKTLIATLALAAFSLTAVSLSFAAQPYPLKTCIVSGESLGSMGKPVTKVYKDQEVKFCCKSCIKKFDKNPEKYLSKLR